MELVQAPLHPFSKWSWGVPGIFWAEHSTSLHRKGGRSTPLFVQRCCARAVSISRNLGEGHPCTAVLCTGSGRSEACLNAVGRVRECLTRDRQQFEHFTYNVTWCAWMWCCCVTEWHAYDFVTKYFVIKRAIICARPCIFENLHFLYIYPNFRCWVESINIMG